MARSGPGPFWRHFCCLALVAIRDEFAAGTDVIRITGNVTVPVGSEADSQSFNPADSGLLDHLENIPGIRDVLAGPLGILNMDGHNIDNTSTPGCKYITFDIHNMTYSLLRHEDLMAVEALGCEKVADAMAPVRLTDPCKVVANQELVAEHPGRRLLGRDVLVNGPEAAWAVTVKMVYDPEAEGDVNSKLCADKSVPISIAKDLEGIPNFNEIITGPVAVGMHRPWCPESGAGDVCFMGFQNGSSAPCSPVPRDPGISSLLWLLMLLWLIVGTALVSRLLVRGSSTPSKRSAAYDPLPQPRGRNGVYDVIIVPGGGSTASGVPPHWVQERLKMAKKVFERSRAQGKSDTVNGAPMILLQSAGSPSDGQLAGTLEAQANARYLESQGLPPSSLHKDDLSFNTLGNAYHARARYADPNQLQNVAVVTNRFHMRRVRAIFQRVFELPPLPTSLQGGYHLTFVEAADVGIAPETLRVRDQHEQQALAWFNTMTHEFSNMDALNSYLKETVARPHMGSGHASATYDGGEVSPRIHQGSSTGRRERTMPAE